MTKQELFVAIQQHLEFNAAVQEIAIKMAKARQLTFHPPEECYDDFEIEVDANGNSTITANFSDYYSGDTDYNAIAIPLEYFWTEDVFAAETEAWAAHCAKVKRLAEEKKKRDAEERQHQDEERDRKLYERLKKKYEGGK